MGLWVGVGLGFSPWGLPIVSIVVPVLDNQNLGYRILTIKLVNQEGTTMETYGDSRYRLS